MESIINSTLNNPIIKKPVNPKYKQISIVINNLENTLTLSNEAMKHIKNEIDETIVICDDLNNHNLPEHIQRDDPKLISIINLLGERANGFGSNIIIKKYYLPYDHTFKVNCNFGKEMVFSLPVNIY